MDKSKVISAIDELERNHEDLRKLVPYRKSNELGKRIISGHVFHEKNQFDHIFKFDKPLDREMLNELNHWGHFLNQNILIRLLALLQAFQVISYGSPVDETRQGGREMGLLKQLRNIFAHDSGKYDPNNIKHIRAATLMNDLLDINFNLQSPGEFNLSIDTVIRPLFEAAKLYVNDET